jgi:quercetin dioxygenase-like cupin family protein
MRARYYERCAGRGGEASRVVVFATMSSEAKLSSTRKVEKPWGHEIIWAETPKYVGKILHIKAGHRLSRQYHRVKEETLRVLAGAMDLEVGDAGALATLRMNPGDTFHVRPNTIHRMVAVEDTDVLEVSTPELDDVVRLEDSYGREGTSAA